MLLRGTLFAPEPRGHVLIEVTGERIGSIVFVAPGDPAPPGALGGPDAILGPGLIDIQVNGAFGQDFSDPGADASAVSRGLTQFGVTGYLACVVTSPTERYGPCLANLAATNGERVDGAARLLGVHVEGPFLSPRRPGTHRPDWLMPVSTAFADTWLEGGSVRLVTVAPELPGALELIRRLVSDGVVVSMGHTDATWEQAAAGAAAGATLGTHLFNAMRRFDHRDPGVAGFLLASHLSVSVIGDGQHVDLGMVELVSRFKSPDELILITDALAGLGMEPGRFELAGTQVDSDGLVGRRSDGVISGSLLPLDAALGNLIRTGIPPENALRAATVNPARLLGLEHEAGTVEVGRLADLVVFDADWRARYTLVGGQVASHANQVVAGRAS